VTSRYAAATVRSRQMLRVLNEKGLIVTDDVQPMALALLALSSFYSTYSFAQAMQIFVIIWRVWEDKISPQDVQAADAKNAALETLLKDWMPPKEIKPS
jgi:hypothetical protein